MVSTALLRSAEVAEQTERLRLVREEDRERCKKACEPEPEPEPI